MSTVSEHLSENGIRKMKSLVKGAPEALINVSNLSHTEVQHIQSAIDQLSKEGYRVLGVGLSNFEGKSYLTNQQDLPFVFKGIVAFYDPPKKNISKVLNDFYAAGIEVKIITGDNSATTQTIAKQIGFKGYEKSISGDDLMKLPDDDFQKAVTDFTLFTRMFPEAKLRIINALKANNQIVAMTGDGVNDGPALKAAHIGIAMGKKGTEIAKQAASLILLEDDLSKMVEAVAMGRKIYTNLKKAIQYIISIHIPIILTVFIPLALGLMYPNIFSPIHIIFLEIIMGPTCSIIYENEPIEKNTMQQKPKALTSRSSRAPTASVLYQAVFEYSQEFEYSYEERYQQEYGCLRQIVKESFGSYLNCGVVRHGCARVVCTECEHTELTCGEPVEPLRSLASAADCALAVMPKEHISLPSTYRVIFYLNILKSM